MVRLVPSKQQREQWAQAREKNLQTAEREREQDIAAEKAREAVRVRDRQRALHKSGKQRAREVHRGGELEIESDEELADDRSLHKTTLDDVMREEQEPVHSEDAVTSTGERISAEVGLLRVLEALRAPRGDPCLSSEELAALTAIDLLDPANAAFKARVLRSSGVHVSFSSPSTLLLKKASPLGLESERCLLDLFQNRIPSGSVKSRNGRPAYAVSEEEIDGAYEGVSAHIDWAIAERVIAAYTEEGREKWRVLIPRLPWAASSKELSALWRACPRNASEQQLRENALSAGVRTLLRINTVDERNKVHRERAQRLDALQQPLRKKKPAPNEPRLPGLASTKRTSSGSSTGASLLARRKKEKSKKEKVPVLMAATAAPGGGGYLSDVFD
mgnify:CR=1 FL=1